MNKMAILMLIIFLISTYVVLTRLRILWDLITIEWSIEIILYLKANDLVSDEDYEKSRQMCIESINRAGLFYLHDKYPDFFD